MKNKYLGNKAIVPKLGVFKMASFKYIPKDKELLFQPTRVIWHTVFMEQSLKNMTLQVLEWNDTYL